MALATVSVHGPNYGIIKPSWLENTIYEFVRAYAYLLDIAKPNIEVEVVLEPANKKRLDKHNALGYSDCEFTEDKTYEVNIQIVRLQNIEQLCILLAHEMIHAKQFIKGDLSMNVRFKNASFGEEEALEFFSTWKGKKWVSAKNDDPYFDSPWEKEAYDQEEILYEKALTLIREHVIIDD